MGSFPGPFQTLKLLPAHGRIARPRSRAQHRLPVVGGRGASVPISSLKRVIIIGAGPQGLATGIELLANGCDVTILESQDQLGLGVSYRPDFN
jgi:NADPH-dependent 2,4-dienoyl-CoA reductase/sulfur reductase-like enzyme